MSYLFVGLGDGLGAMLRICVSQLMPFTFGKMSANIIDFSAKWIVFVTIGAKVRLKDALFLMKGVLGGSTILSAFSLDAFRLLEAGKMGLTVGYVTLSVALSVLALRAGIMFVTGGNA